MNRNLSLTLLDVKLVSLSLYGLDSLGFWAWDLDRDLGLSKNIPGDPIDFVEHWSHGAQSIMIAMNDSPKTKNWNLRLFELD